MPTVDIYRAGTKIDSRKFQRDFMIVMKRREIGLRWEADEETASKEGGGIVIWIRAGMRPPEIHFVPPGWKLIIDGVTVIGEGSVAPESRFEIPIKGRTVELQHGDLSFVFQFN